MTDRVVVTGATGTIGRIVCDVLAERGLDVVPVALPDHDLTESGGEWADLVASADTLVHLAGVMQVGLLPARVSLIMLWNVLETFRGRRLIVASSAAVDPEAFDLLYAFNTYSARCASTEAFARAWGCDAPGRRVDALRFGRVVEAPVDFGHRGAHCAPARVAEAFGTLILEDAPGFRARFVLGSG